MAAVDMMYTAVMMSERTTKETGMSNNETWKCPLCGRLQPSTREPSDYYRMLPICKECATEPSMDGRDDPEWADGGMGR